jgi:cytoskeletal protein RodZ
MSGEDMDQVKALTVSDQLRQAREAAGLTQAAVADALFLTVTYIRYMDAGEFERLPKQAFVRGYLRSYARVVGLDGGLLVQLYDEEFRETLAEMPADVSVSVQENRFSGPVVLTGLIGLGIVLILVLLVWLLIPDDDNASAMKPTPPAPARVNQSSGSTPDSVRALVGSSALTDPSFEASPVEAVAIDKALGEKLSAGSAAAPAPRPDWVADFDRSTPVTVAPVERPITVSENVVLGTLNGEAGLLADVEDVIQAESTLTDLGAADGVNNSRRPGRLSDEQDVQFNLDVGGGISGRVNIRRENRDDGRQILVDAGGSDELKATLIGECWIEVADSQNELIYGDLNRAGDVLLLTGRAPLTVLLGNAPMASIEFNGRLVDLESATTRDAIARLTLTN